MQNKIIINTISELPIAAKQLLQSLGNKKIVAFYGEMGVGKTTFIKSICELMGVAENITSPTFSIVNEYRSSTGEKIFHFDFYRIKSLNEAYDMGYEDYFYSNAFCFVEWPEKIEELLPKDVVKVKLSVNKEQRVIEF